MLWSAMWSKLHVVKYPQFSFESFCADPYVQQLKSSPLTLYSTNTLLNTLLQSELTSTGAVSSGLSLFAYEWMSVNVSLC